MPRIAIEADANISVVLTANFEREQAVRRTMLLNEV
jgi:hypothetical protein